MTNRILVSEADENHINSYQVAIKFAGHNLFKSNMIYPQYIDACIEREKKYPTGLALKNNIGVAIPHGNPKFVKESGISFVRLAQPINFGLMEDSTKQVSCQFVFNLAILQSNQQLAMLRQLMALFRNDDFIGTLAKAELDHIQKYLIQKLSFN